MVATRNSLARPRCIDEALSVITPFTAKPELLSLVFEHLQVPVLKAPADAMLFAAWVVDEQQNMSNLVQERSQYQLRIAVPCRIDGASCARARP